MGRERRELGLPRLTPKLLWGLNGLARVSPWKIPRFYLPMFSVRLQSSEGRTPDRSARKSPVVPSTKRGASPVEHPGGNVQGSALADASPLNRKVEADNCTNQGRTRRTSQCLRPVFRTPDGRCDGFWGASRVETASKLLFDGEDWSSRRVDSFNKNS